MGRSTVLWSPEMVPKTQNDQIAATIQHRHIGRHRCWSTHIHSTQQSHTIRRWIQFQVNTLSSSFVSALRTLAVSYVCVCQWDCWITHCLHRVQSTDGMTTHAERGFYDTMNGKRVFVIRGYFKVASLVISRFPPIRQLFDLNLFSFYFIRQNGRNDITLPYEFNGTSLHVMSTSIIINDDGDEKKLSGTHIDLE